MTGTNTEEKLRRKIVFIDGLRRQAPPPVSAEKPWRASVILAPMWQHIGTVVLTGIQITNAESYLPDNGRICWRFRGKASLDENGKRGPWDIRGEYCPDTRYGWYEVV